jgi:N-acetylmuramoyl-L-alanine amidase
MGSMKTSDPIIGPSRATATATRAWAHANGAARPEFLDAYCREVGRLCDQADMVDAAVVFAQGVHETSEGGRPWNSHWWRSRGNPAGLGITGDPEQNRASETFETGEEAAKAHVAHLLLYATGAIRRGGLTPADDPRYAAYKGAYGSRAMATTIAGLTQTWGMDPNYAQKLVGRGNAMYPDIRDATPGKPGPLPNRPYVTSVPGLPGGPLRTAYPIRLNPIALDGYQRTGQKARTPRRSVQHGTGNASNASAWQEAQYFVNGAGGRQASIHACADDREVVICVPLDEVTWQAADGAGPGNMNGYSCEMMEATAIWTQPARRDALIRITADFMGRVAARLGVTKPEQHYTFNYGNAPGARHDCPNKLRHTTIGGEPAWNVYARQWEAARKDELRGETRPPGTTTTTTTTAAPPPTLPPGMSGGLADKLYNPDRVAEPDGTVPDYAQGDPPSDAWLGHVLAHNPAGKTWEDYPWPPLASITRRGDGRLVWQWSDGFVFEEAAEDE